MVIFILKNSLDKWFKVKKECPICRRRFDVEKYKMDVLVDLSQFFLPTTCEYSVSFENDVYAKRPERRVSF